MLAPEMANPAPGSKLVVQHLADILFVHVCVLLAQLSSESFIWRPANFGDELYACDATSIRACGAGLSAAFCWSQMANYGTGGAVPRASVGCSTTTSRAVPTKRVSIGR
jgi:hypothetical protein